MQMANIHTLEKELKRRIRNGFGLEDIEEIVNQIQEENTDFSFEPFYELANDINEHSAELHGELSDVVEYLHTLA
jgi:hypothetical protein